MSRQVENIHGVTTSSREQIHDARGWFLPALTEIDPKHDWILQNFSNSEPGTLRGLHSQVCHPQNKFLILLQGTLQDIVADLRPTSPTYLKFAVYHLDANDLNQIFIPQGCAHGFLVTGNKPALVSYLADAPYEPEDEKTLAWNDPEWNFPWLRSDPILSQKDRGESSSDEPAE